MDILFHQYDAIHAMGLELFSADVMIAEMERYMKRVPNGAIRVKEEEKLLVKSHAQYAQNKLTCI